MLIYVMFVACVVFFLHLVWKPVDGANRPGCHYTTIHFLMPLRLLNKQWLAVGFFFPVKEAWENTSSKCKRQNSQHISFFNDIQ